MTVGALQRTPGKRRQRTLGGGGAASGLRLPGIAGNYLSTPDSVINSITGDVDIRVYCKLTSWASGSVQNIIAKRDFSSGANASYGIRVGAGGSLSGVIWSAPGGTLINADSVIINGSTVPFTAGQAGWIRMTADVDNGAGGNTITLYYAVDGTTWTSMGSLTTAGVVSIIDTAAVILLGGGTSGQEVNGTIYYAEVRNGIDGPIVVKFDSSQVQVSGAQTPAMINGWTWNGAALYKRDDYVRLPGTSGNYLSYPDTAANSVTGDIDIRAKVSADSWTPAGAVYVIGKEVVGARSYCFGLSAGGQIEMRFSTDGTNAIAVNSSVIAGFASGTTNWIRATRQASSGNCNFYTSSDGSTWSLLGMADRNGTAGNIADSTSAVELGSRVNGTANLWAGNVYYAEVRNGINGPIAASFNGADNQVQTPWTINGAGWNWEIASFTGKSGIVYSQPQVAGNYITTPNTTALQLTNADVDIRAKAALDNWADGVNFQALVSKRASGQDAYQLRVDPSGAVTLLYWVTGVNAGQPSTVATGLSPGQVKWIRATLLRTNGANAVTSYFMSDDGIIWTPLGTPRTNAIITSIDATTAALNLTTGDLGTAQLMKGKLYYAEVRNGIDGPIVAKFDPTNIAKTGTRTPTTTVQPGGSPNLIDPNTASIETSAAGWQVGANLTLAQDATQFLDGTKSLSLTSVAAGDMTAITSLTGVNAYPVAGLKSYTAKVSYRAAVSPRNTRVELRWYDAAGATLSTDVGSQVADTTTGWTEASITAIAPATAKTAALIERVLATGAAAEVHYSDRISLVETPTPWTMNGANWDLVAA